MNSTEHGGGVAEMLQSILGYLLGAGIETRWLVIDGNQDFFDRFSPEAREILEELVQKYEEYGLEQLKLPDVLKVPPLSRHGNPSEIARSFGGPEELRAAVEELESLLYAA